MEAALRRSRGESSGHEQGYKEGIVTKAVNAKKDYEDDKLKSSPPTETDLSCSNQVQSKTKREGSPLEPNSGASSITLKDHDEQLEAAKAEMGEVREENQRLKMYLKRMTKDYQALQMQFYDIVKQEPKKSMVKAHTEENKGEHELSLSLGRTSSDAKKEENTVAYGKTRENDGLNKEGLALKLDCEFEDSVMAPTESVPHSSPENSLNDTKEEAGEAWPPRKVMKTTRSGDDEASQPNPVKKARVSVRARCDTPTMNDGCQWRKYGQKIAKGNPCPRAYYRCTVAPSCPVRKQVQRCSEDMSILITTYEGTHNHPLPVSATAMASTTSAAASMLLSGSTTSQQGSTLSATSTANELHGINYYLTNNSNQFYLPNSSISNSPSCPTVTLDLTSAASSHFNKLSSSFGQTPRYQSTSLDFSSSFENNALPISWGNALLSYGSQTYNKNQIGALNIGRQTQENHNLYHSYVQKNNPTPQQTLPDTIAAATKAITSDPSFQTALAAALKSIIGGAGSGSANQGGGESNGGQKLKWGENLQVVSTYLSNSKGNGCASSYLNSSTTTNSQTGGMMFLPPSFPFSASKSASASPGDNRES